MQIAYAYILNPVNIDWISHGVSSPRNVYRRSIRGEFVNPPQSGILCVKLLTSVKASMMNVEHDIRTETTSGVVRSNTTSTMLSSMKIKSMIIFAKVFYTVCMPETTHYCRVECA